MHSRRDFLQRAALLSGSAFLAGSIPESILAALRIDPEKGSTYLDAEHVVILMQENRSFDHTYGTLRGVRGFGDPRVFVQPSGMAAWFQSDAKGNTFGPFRLDIKGSNATWMGSLPHSWTNQNDARNFGRYDNWLFAKASDTKEFSQMPLTLGFYSRADIPFYYALADAFTVCDQNFCSSLTGTNPNRLHLWTGTVRPTKDNKSFARVRNEEIDYGVEADWTTFPERLEDAGISWRVYQNEISIQNGFSDDEDFWLSSFGDNPLEWFTQYNIRFTKGHQNWMRLHQQELAENHAATAKRLSEAVAGSDEHSNLARKLDEIAKEREEHEAYVARWSPDKWNELDARAKALHTKAFVINDEDPKYRSLTTLKYADGANEREVRVPEGDVLYQFRKDVESGALPTVSWLVSPEAFSDHPASAWYGAWYLAEAIDILTKNPEVWKKTIFILCYDENDGYFDHVQPFVAPDPTRPETGKTSASLDTSADYITLEQDMKRYAAADARGGSIGLGFRVPLVVASPWSRGGAVNSQVFDHTSILMFLETFLTAKTGKQIREHNITDWRRTVCGDLTTVFRPFDGAAVSSLEFPPRDEFIEDIHRAQFRGLPKGMDAIEKSAHSAEYMRAVAALQEPGTRASCPLPYELYADAVPAAPTGQFSVRMAAGNRAFGKKSAGAPFMAYSYAGFSSRAYALVPGDSLEDSWAHGPDGKYHVRVDGPNGFTREFVGAENDPKLEIRVEYASHRGALTGDVVVVVANHDSVTHDVEIVDKAYGEHPKRLAIAAGGRGQVQFPASKVAGWYDFSLGVQGHDAFARHCAGRVETGRWSTSDPQFGRV